MFGFLNPRPHDRPYRRVYARLCQHQRIHYGVTSLPFHSYEAAFLFQCAVDAGAVSLDHLPDVRCCRLSTRGPLRRAPDSAVGRFCASFALLLASIKLDDDVADTRSLPARLARWLMRSRSTRAWHYFERLDPAFGDAVGRHLSAHAELERRQGHSLEDYARPTAEAFGYLFGLAEMLPGMWGRGETLRGLGRHVGAALIAFDCAVDWHRDRRRGHYNPLEDEAQVADALRDSGDQLAQAARLSSRAFGPGALSLQTLEKVRDRVLARAPSACEAQVRPVHWLLRARRATAVGVGLLALPLVAGPPPADDYDPVAEGEFLTTPAKLVQQRQGKPSSCAGCDVCLCPDPCGGSGCLGDACWLGCQSGGCCEGADVGNCGDCNCDCGS